MEILRVFAASRLRGLGRYVGLAYYLPRPHLGVCLRQGAQNVVEYGLLIASIALMVLVGVAKFGSVIEPWFKSLAGLITTAGT